MKQNYLLISCVVCLIGLLSHFENIVLAQENGGSDLEQQYKNFNHLFGTSAKIDESDTTLKQEKTEFPCYEQPIYRTYDGSCNNTTDISKANWGATEIPFKRVIPAVYSEADPLNGMGGEGRMNPREVSNLLCDLGAENKLNHYELSAFCYTWGQFIDHDITLTPVSDELEMIAVPPGDEITSPIMFTRSEPIEGTGAGSEVAREQYNAISAWIDGSGVYGSDAYRVARLRTFIDGKLRTSEGNLLPYNTDTDEKDGTPEIDEHVRMAEDVDHLGNPNVVFVAGDIRANEQCGLTVLHTLFVREHNRICDELIEQGFEGDEHIYQQARMRVGAIIQSITYNEFLPALGIKLENYSGYKSTVKPDITNVFATAAYRLGHTMVSGVLYKGEDGHLTGTMEEIKLRDAFFNPSLIADHGIETFLKGLSLQQQEEVDNFIVEELRTFLFMEETGPGLDLAALNIQRGRDHGLADYNAYRKHYLGTAATSFEDINSDSDLMDILQEAYPDINDIDPWVGFLMEEHEPGMPLGPTLTAIIKKQFRDLRNADYYFYLNHPELSQEDRIAIENTTLADVIERNTDLKLMQRSLFQMPVCLQANVILEGCFKEEAGLMKPALRSTGLFPIVQPYSAAPWHYKGTEKFEALDSVPANAIDWVLLETRWVDNKQYVLERRAAILLDNGQIVDLDGSPDVKFYNLTGGYEYYISIRHRNHLAILSENSYSLPSHTPIDFTNIYNSQGNEDQMAFLYIKENGLKVYGMATGDINGNGIISVDDYIAYQVNVASLNQYTPEDCNMDAMVTVADFNKYKQNISKIAPAEVRYE